MLEIALDRVGGLRMLLRRRSARFADRAIEVSAVLPPALVGDLHVRSTSLESALALIARRGETVGAKSYSFFRFCSMMKGSA